MRKSALSKGSGLSSILNGVICNDDNMQILRISLKKQMDREKKLQKLLQKYQQITNQQKTHIKSIKASIIQLKDIQSKSKTKFHLNPIIYVDNNLSKQTREYLCMLLNTFYSKYQQNTQLQYKTKIVNHQMNSLLEMISKNQEMLLKIQKQTIGQQVQMQGELLGLKNRVKDQVNKGKQVEEEYKRVKKICQQYEDKHKDQLLKVEILRQKCQHVQQLIKQNKNQVTKGQLIKRGKQQMMACQMAYEQKFTRQLSQIDNQIQQQRKRQEQLIRKIKKKKQNVEKFKSKVYGGKEMSREGINRQVDTRVLNTVGRVSVR